MCNSLLLHVLHSAVLLEAATDLLPCECAFDELIDNSDNFVDLSDLLPSAITLSKRDSAVFDGWDQ